MKKNAYIDVENIPGSGGRKSFKSRIAEFVRANIFIPDARMGWRKHAVKKGLEIIKNNNIDLLYSSSPPYTCSLIARDLKRKTGLKWVAGFRDPWTGFLNTPVRKGIAKKIDIKFEHTSYSEADRIEVAWPGIKEDITGKYTDLEKEKIFYVPNGYDPEDFSNPVYRETKENKFTITYTGSMYGLRNPGSFLTAMDKLFEDGTLTPDNVKLNFIGRFGGEARDWFTKTKFKDSVNIVDYVSHTESIGYLLSSDANLLLIDESKDISKIVPGKVFEYLGAKRPIIGIGTKGSDVEKILLETGCGKLESHSNIEGIKNIILEFYNNYKSYGSKGNFNDNKIEYYSRKNLAGKLAGIFDAIKSG